MSHYSHGRIAGSQHASRGTHRSRVGLAVLLALAVSLVVAPAALAKFNVKALHLGSASGAVDYLYTAGNKVVEQGTADRGSWYRFDVYDSSGTAHFHGACSRAATNGAVSAAYPVQSSDPISNATGWRFELREFASKANCTTAASATNDASLYFDLAAATSYGSSALTTTQSAFGAGRTAYVQVTGAGKVNNGKSNPGTNTAQGIGTWSTTWLLPSGATACANTVNNASDLPGSAANGQLPGASSYLQYAPSSGPGLDPWNQLANYETQPCPAFSSSNQGQWGLKLSADSTHFVTLPAFTVNTTPPHTTLTSGPSNTSSSTSATFTFTSSEQGSTFQCELDSATWTPCTSPQTYSGLANGAHTFSVRATDPAGNVDPTPAGTAWIVDTSAPPVTLAKPAAGSYLNSATPTFAGSADPASGDSKVTVDVYSGTGVTGSLVQAPSATVQSDGTWTVNASTLPDGTYTAQAQQTDTVKRTGYSAQDTFTVDTTPPTVTVTLPTNGTHTDDATPEIAGTAGYSASDLPTVTIAIAQGGTTVQTATATVSPSGTWDFNLPAALPDGNYTLQASQKDLAGNTGYSSSQTLTIDTTPPQTFLDAAPPSGSVTSSTSAAFTFHSTDALSQAGSSFQCQIDGGAWGACSSPKSFYNLANGSHTFSVEAVDGAGNLDTTGQSDTWTVNTSLPLVTLGSPANGSFTNHTTPTFSGTAGTAPGDSSTVQVLIYSNTNLSGSPVQTLTTTASSGSWSTAATSALSDGTYVVYAQQSGTAGTANSAVHTFTVVTQAPTTTITLGPPGTSGTGDAAFSFTSSAQDSTFQCQLDGAGWISCSSPQDYSGLADGSHTFQVRSIDRGGNVGAAASQTWTVNSSLPSLSLSSPADGTVTNNPTPAIAGTGGIAAGDAATVTVKLYSGTTTAGTPLQTLTTTVSSSDGSWSTHPSPALADGTYTAYATQVGSAGTAYTSAHTFTINSTPPTTTIISGPQGTTSATSARFAFSSSAAGSTFQCQLDTGAWAACSSPKTYSGLAVGQHTFSVRATDPAGNVDPDPPTASWTIDTPTNVPVTLTSPADGTVTNNNAPTFSGTASSSNGNGISVEINDANGNVVEVLSTGSGSSWSVQASPSLPDGSYTAFASQLGTDGVTTDYSAVIGFTVDTDPPNTSITSAPHGTTSATSARFAFTSSEPGSTFQCKLDAGSWTSCSSPQSYSSLTAGAHTFSVRATDVAGNTDPTPAVATWTIDASTPLTLSAPVDGATTNATPTFSGAASAANSSGISVEVDDASGNVVELLGATSGSSSSWSLKASPALPEGTYTAFASQLGTDGVTTDYSTMVAFTVDATPPTVTLTSAPTGTSNNKTPSFGGALGTAAGDQPSVTLKLYSGTGTSGTPVQTAAATVSGSSWSATATTLPDGTYTARAEQADSVGNVGYTAKRTFTIDTVPPSTSITDGPSGSNTATSATFSFSSSKPSSTFQCRVDGAAWGGCASPQSYNGLAVGQHTFAVRATDAVGNVDPTPPSRSWTITAPASSAPPPTSSTPQTSATPSNPAPPITPSPPSVTIPKLQLTLTAKAVQHLAAHAKLIVKARCSKACTLVLSGKLAITRSGKLARRTKPLTILVSRLTIKKLAAGRSVTLTIKLSAKTRKAIAAALANKQRTALTLTGVVSARGMKPGSATVTIRLLP